MKLHLLGSSAGKTVPRPFCTCRVCRTAIAQGGRDLRTRTSLHIYPKDTGDTASQTAEENHSGTEKKGKGAREKGRKGAHLPTCSPTSVLPILRSSVVAVRYKVDLSPDTGHHIVRERFNMSCLEHLLITHPHPDHFAPGYLTVRPTVLSDPESVPYLNLYGGQNTINLMIAKSADLERLRIRPVVVQPFRRFRAGELDVFPLRAAHILPAEAFNFVVQCDGQTVLLAWDTGMWAEETWEAAADFRFDAVFLECTALGPGGRAAGVSHNNLDSFLAMKDRLGEQGCLKENAPFVAVHIGDNGRLTHEEAQELVGPCGVTVGYDGMWIDVMSNE